MEKKQIYLEKSLRLFLKHGVRSVTIGDIANELNISTKTIYKLFGDKTGLVNTCFELDKQIIANTYKRILEREEVLVALIEFYHELVNRITRVNPNYYDDIRKYFPEIWEETKAFGTQQIKALLLKGANQGIFLNNLDVSVVAETVTLLIRAALDENFEFGIGQDRSKLSANMIYPYLRGICTAQGLHELEKQAERAQLVG